MDGAASEILDEALDFDQRQEVVSKLGYENDLGNTAIYVMEKLLRQGGATCIITDDFVGEQLIAEQMAIMTELGFYTRFENRDRRSGVSVWGPACLYQKPKSGRSGDEVRQGSLEI